MSSDRTFQFAWVPNRYADRLQRATVLYPLTKTCRSARQIVQHTDRLVRWWRARLAALQQFGWTPRYSEEGLFYARNCLPAFAYAMPRTVPCGNPSICPFCYARWARAAWETIDASFPNPRADTDRQLDAGDDQPVEGEATPEQFEDRTLRAVQIDPPPDREYARHLVTYFSNFRVPRLSPGMSDDRRELYVRTLMEEATAARYRRIRRRGAIGAFSNLTVEPTRRGWLFRVRELYMVDRDFVLPEPTIGRFHRCAQPTRGAVLQATIRVCRYPPRLLLGDPEWTAVFLRARQGTGLNRSSARLTGMYGSFRNRSDTHVSVHDRND